DIPPKFSDHPVRYYDGATHVEGSPDLWSDGFGEPWGRVRSWSNAFVNSTGSRNGLGWVDSRLPVLLNFNDGASPVVISNATTGRIFQRQPDGTYKVALYLKDKLVHVGAQYVVTDEVGDQLRFWDYSPSVPAGRQGQFESFADPYGNLTYVYSRTPDEKIAEV